MKDLTSVVFGANFLQPSGERIVVDDEKDDTEEFAHEQVSVDDALVNMLKRSIIENRPKDFHRRDLALDSKLLNKPWRW